MTVSIGGVALEPESDVIWQDRYASQDVAQVNRRTLGLRLVVFAGALVAGKAITLQATDNYGWLRKATVDALIALANVPGAIYTLVFGAETFSVIFDHSGGPAVDMKPLVARVAHATTDYFTGTIKLLTV